MLFNRKLVTKNRIKHLELKCPQNNNLIFSKTHVQSIERLIISDIIHISEF